MASQNQGIPPNSQSDIVNGDASILQPYSQTADALPSSLAPGNSAVRGPVNGETTNRQPDAMTTAPLPLSMTPGNPTGNGPIMTWNQFDQALLTGQQRESALQTPEMTNFLAALSRALPPSPAHYTGNDGLQAYLIRQQICVGIPLDQIEPMNGPGARRRARMETRGPVMIDVSDRGVRVPMIRPAQFSGILYPLPLHPWLPYPEGYPQAHATRGPGENAASDTLDGQSQGMAATNDEGQQTNLGAPVANGEHETDSQGDTQAQQSGSNNALVNHPHGMDPASDYSYQPASHNELQLDGDIDMMGPGLTESPDGFPVENMTPPMMNISQPLNAQLMMRTNAHIGNAQAMIQSSAYLDNGQPVMGSNSANDAQSYWMNDSSINHEYGQPMTHNNQPTGFQNPDHFVNGSNPSLWTLNNQSAAGHVSQGPFPSVAGNTSNNHFQTSGTNHDGTIGLPLNNDTANPYASYQPMLSNNQVGAARFPFGVTDGNVQYAVPNAAQSMTDYLDQIPPPQRPNGSSVESDISNELAIFFDNEEEQRIITNFYVNHFSAPHGA